MKTRFLDLKPTLGSNDSLTECISEYAISVYSEQRALDIYDDDNLIPSCFYIYDVSGEDNILTIYRHNSTETKYFSYSFNGYDWVDVDTSNGDIHIEIEPYGKVYIVGDNISLNTESSAIRINCQKEFGAGGGLLSLIYPNAAMVGPYGFKELFIGSNLVEANKLTIVSVNNRSCFRLFANCAKLVTPPELPATALANNCYQNMFYGCTSLTAAPVLPATALAQYCYASMFSGCTSLTTAPTLPATSLAGYCYSYMFQKCTSLTTTPALPATALTNNCYEYMFDGCTALVAPSALPATTLRDYCYQYMFNGCSSLVTAPAMSPTTLMGYCCRYMFQNCTSLTTPPTLPATTLANGCYQYMFYGCASLTTAPELPATTLVSQCYQYMFRNCTHLNHIKVGATAWNTSYASNWVNNVASSGTFEKLTSTSIATGVNGIPTSWTVQEYTPTRTPSLIIHNTSGQSNDITIARQGSPTAVTIYYSTNGTTYTSFSTSTNLTVTLSSGQSLYIDGALKSTGTSSYYKITGTQNHTVEGTLNVTQAYHYNHFFYNDTKLTDASGLTINIQSSSATLCCAYMFQGCTSLTAAPTLPTTTLAAQCYQSMFQGCSALTTAPTLSAATLSTSCYTYMFQNCTTLTSPPMLPAGALAQDCYRSMFEGCTALTTAPALPALSLAQTCYQYMFQNCTALTTAPTLPATILMPGCYQYMFKGCSALTTAPALPATTLAIQCYQYMFQNCTHLTTAPALPALTLTDNCYLYMFAGCTALTTAPELPALTLKNNCYGYMFYGCTHLNYIKALFTTTPSSTYTNNWVYNVASSGTFVKRGFASWNVTGVHGIPTNWVIECEYPYTNFDPLIEAVNEAYPNRRKWIHQNYSVNEDGLCYITVEAGTTNGRTKTLIVGDGYGILATSTVTVSGWGGRISGMLFAYHGNFGFVGRTEDASGPNCYLSLFKYENNQITSIITNTSVNVKNHVRWELSCFTFNGKDYVQGVSNSNNNTLFFYNLTDRQFKRSEGSGHLAGCCIEQNGNKLMYLIAGMNGNTNGLRVSQMTSIGAPNLTAVSNILTNDYGLLAYRKMPVAFSDTEYVYLIAKNNDGWYEVSISSDYTTISESYAFPLFPDANPSFRDFYDFMLIDGYKYYYNPTTYDIEKTT